MKINMIVKNQVILILFLSLYGFCEPLSIVCSEQMDGYEITGEISGVPDGTIFFLVKNGGEDTVSATKILNGLFRFTGSLQQVGELYFIKLDTTFVKLPKERKSYVRLLLDHSKIRVSGALDQWPETKIIGSDATKTFEFLYAEMQRRVDSTEKIFAEISVKYYGSDKQSQMDAALKLHYQKLFVFFSENSNSLATPFLVYNYAPDDVEYISLLYNNFSKKVKGGYYAHCLMEERVPQIKARSLIAAGNQIPDLNSLYDKKGRQVSILSIAKKSKLTLVDFWASWCKPCRIQTPKLKAIYNEFRDKGFNIVGISQDIKEDSWLKAMKDDGMEWINVLDKSKSTLGIFGLDGIPAYLLIDENGRMISFWAVSTVPIFGPSLKSDELHNTIKTLLNKLSDN